MKVTSIGTNSNSPSTSPANISPLGNIIVSSGNHYWQDPYTKIEHSINERLDNIERQLLILKPSIELHEKYPALKEAFEAYQLVLKMVEGPGSENNGV